jgi:hypothetical protein
MSKLFLVMALTFALALVTIGCATKEGSREYTPGKGWQQN